MGKLFENLSKPSYEEFVAKLNSLNSSKYKLLRDGRIVYLPSEGTGVFIGDLHGDFEAVVSIVKQTNFLERMSGDRKIYLVFLGDYGDRGTKIIKTINAVITLKLLYPKNVVLLRGNHEEPEIADAYGTHDIFKASYGTEKGNSLFELYCSVMSNLPVVAITPSGIIGVHGGIPSSDINSINVLNSELGESYAREMTWNDPDPRVSGRNYNSRGGSTTVFGEDAFNDFMKVVSANLMVRSHQYPQDGVELLFNNRLATIFSNGSSRSLSSGYKNHVRRAVFLKTELSKQKKERFEKSDFVEILY